MENRLKPRSIELIGEGLLAVVWEDGHESFYDAALLRAHCPCAECRNKRMREEGATTTAPKGLSLVMAPPRIVGVESIGRYAVRPRFSDGHSAGLFEHRLLRGLCPCASCA